MGCLPLDDETIERVRALARRAERWENWYWPGEAAVPGDLPEFRELVGAYRVVFTHTASVEDGKLFRHLSVGLHDRSATPHPTPVFTIAHWLGFTGATPNQDGVVGVDQARELAQAGWIWELRDGQIPHVVVVQEIGPLPS